MKKLVLLLSLACVSAFAEPAIPSAEQKAPPAATTEDRAPATVDFFNFDAMRQGVLGKYVRRCIFDFLAEHAGTVALMGKLNKDFALRLPDSLRIVSIVHFPPEAETPRFNVAQIKTTDDLSAFFSAMRKQEKTAEFSIDGLHFSELPRELGALVPEIFKSDDASVFAAQTKDRGELVLIACPRDAFPRLAQSDFSIKFPDESEKFPLPGVLAFRVFPRRSVVAEGKDGEPGVFASVPAGDFLLEENSTRARIRVKFLCENPLERQMLRVFFAELKSQIHADAPELGAIADSIRVCDEGATAIRFELGGNAREFAEFLAWREKRTPSPQPEREKAAAGDVSF